MAKLIAYSIIVLIFAFVCQPVFSLQCYTCSAPLSINSDCENLEFIPPSACSTDEVCATFVLKNPEIEILHRKCSSDDVCNLLATQYENNLEVDVEGCEVCNQDACNGLSIS